MCGSDIGVWAFSVLGPRRLTMKQALLDHTLARVTGESVRRIRRIGFSLVQPRCCIVLPKGAAAARPTRPRVKQG
jgi:hypothetical protein